MDQFPKSIERRGKGRGKFFQIDGRLWTSICEVGFLPAVSYLVLAQGSDSKNTITRWSVHSVEKYTGMSRPKAKAAIASLVSAGLVRVDQAGTRPIYVLQNRREYVISRLSSCAVSELEQIIKGEQLKCVSESLLASCLVKRDGEFYEMQSALPDTPAWIWLPNSIVTGVGREVPPLAKLRRLQNLKLLWLFVELYRHQDLEGDSGIARDVIQGVYSSKKLASFEQFDLMGFRIEHLSCGGDESEIVKTFKLPDKKEKYPFQPFFDAMNILEEERLVDQVPYVIESTALDAEPVHPCGVSPGFTSQEEKIAKMATVAGGFMSNFLFRVKGLKGLETVRSEWGIILPVPRHLRNASVVGIFRLHYRPRTFKTTKWMRQQYSNSHGGGYIEEFQHIAQKFGWIDDTASFNEADDLSIEYDEAVNE